MSKLLYGDSAARLVSERIHSSVATLAALKGTPANRRVAAMTVYVQDSQTTWQFDADAALTGDDVLVCTPTAGSGRWLRMPGPALLELPFFATTPTGTNLLVVPTGCILRPKEFAWKITRVFTGASNAGVAVSSTNHPGHTGIANFMGTAVATNINQFIGTGGTGLDFTMGAVASGTFDSNENKRTWMKPGDTVRLDVIGAAFGTGIGAVLFACDVLKNSGG